MATPAGPPNKPHRHRHHVEQQRTGVVDVDARAERGRRPGAEQRMVGPEHVERRGVPTGRCHRSTRTPRRIPRTVEKTITSEIAAAAIRQLQARAVDASGESAVTITSSLDHARWPDEHRCLLAEEQHAHGSAPGTPATAADRGTSRTGRCRRRAPDRRARLLRDRRSVPSAARRTRPAVRRGCAGRTTATSTTRSSACHSSTNPPVAR